MMHLNCGSEWQTGELCSVSDACIHSRNHKVLQVHLGASVSHSFVQSMSTSHISLTIENLSMHHNSLRDLFLFSNWPNSSCLWGIKHKQCASDKKININLTLTTLKIFGRLVFKQRHRQCRKAAMITMTVHVWSSKIHEISFLLLQKAGSAIESTECSGGWFCQEQNLPWSPLRRKWREYSEREK